MYSIDIPITIIIVLMLHNRPAEVCVGRQYQEKKEMSNA